LALEVSAWPVFGRGPLGETLWTFSQDCGLSISMESWLVPRLRRNASKCSGRLEESPCTDSASRLNSGDGRERLRAAGAERHSVQSQANAAASCITANGRKTTNCMLSARMHETVN
jgi:hypothetical protein